MTITLHANEHAESARPQFSRQRPQRSARRRRFGHPLDLPTGNESELELIHTIEDRGILCIETRELRNHLTNTTLSACIREYLKGVLIARSAMYSVHCATLNEGFAGDASDESRTKTALALSNHTAELCRTATQTTDSLTFSLKIGLIEVFVCHLMHIDPVQGVVMHKALSALTR